ncbi:MAG TPA: thioredoxin family protein [Christiangramia sp.]|nr:thioredoxin family protein [Christiangramia sp.]
MKRLIIALLVTLVIPVEGQVDFKNIKSKSDMDEVWSESERLNQPVFVDIYATWCGPCKWMDANVFAIQEAGNYMNEEFINVKIDGESEFGRIFAMKSGLNAYPSFFLYKSATELMHSIVGSKEWPEFKVELESTLTYYPVVEVLLSKFESSLLEREEFPRLIEALREMGKEGYRAAVSESYKNKYLDDEDWNETDLRVMAYNTSLMTEDWNLLTADIPELKVAMGEELEDFINHLVTLTIDYSVENNDVASIDALNEILPELTKGTILKAETLMSRTYVYYYHYTEQFDSLITYIDDTYRKRGGGDHEWLFNAASDAVFLNPQNEKMATKGLEWFSTCLELKKSHEYFYHLALCQYFTNSPGKSVETLKRSLDYTNEQETITVTQSIIEQIEAELRGKGAAK